MPVFTFDEINRIIEVDSDATIVTCQELINAIRDWEEELDNIDIAKVADASGKEDLGAGRLVGITLTLLNWRLKFEDRAGPDWVVCNVRGGNLVAVDAAGQPMIPIAPASYVTVFGERDVSAGLIAEWSQSEKDKVINKTDLIPSDLPEVPTHIELQAEHGEGSWTSADTWITPSRSITTREIESDPEHIAAEETLSDIKGSDFQKDIDSLKKIREIVEASKPPSKSKAQYLEKQLREK